MSQTEVTCVSVQATEVVLSIPNELLCTWYSSRRSSTSLVRSLNDCIKPGGIILVKECQSVEDRLRRRVSKVYNKIEKLSQHYRGLLQKQRSNLHVSTMEIITPHELEQQLAIANDSVEQFKYE